MFKCSVTERDHLARGYRYPGTSAGAGDRLSVPAHIGESPGWWGKVGPEPPASQYNDPGRHLIPRVIRREVPPPLPHLKLVALVHRLQNHILKYVQVTSKVLSGVSFSEYFLM